MMPTILGSTAVIAIFSILSKILGLLRIIAFSNRFGAGKEIDIYVAAFRIPDLIFNLLILGTLSVAFIPVFVSYLNRDKEEGFKIASTIFSLTLLVMVAAAILGFLFAPILVRFIAPGFDADASEATAELTRILMLSPLFFGLSSVLTSVLHSFKRFFIAAAASLIYNVSIIFGVLFLYPRFGLEGIAWSVVAGAFLHFALQLPQALKLGLAPFLHFDLKHQGVREIAKLFLPRILGIDLGQISLLVASVIGSTLSVGSIAIFYYAYDLETVPLGVFAIAFAVTAFPVLSEYAAKQDMAGFKNFLSKTMVQLLFLMIPISVLMLILRAQIVRLIPGALEGTKFTFTDTRLTAHALGFFCLSLFAQSVLPLLARSFYALHNTVTPVAAGAVAAVTNVGLAYAFTRIWGAPSMALAFSIAVILDTAILFAILHRRLGDINDEFLIMRLIKISIASIAMGAASYASLYAIAPFVNMQTYVGVLAQTIGATLAAGFAYVAVGLLIRLPEARSLVAIIRLWFEKFSKPVASLFDPVTRI